MQTGKFLFKIISYVTLLRTSKMYFVHESKWFLSDFCYSHFQKMKQCSWSKVQNRLLPSLFFFIFFLQFFSRKVMYIYVFINEKLCLLSYLCLFPRYLVHLSSVRLVSWKWFFVSTLFCMSNTFWPDNVLEQSFIFLLVKIEVFFFIESFYLRYWCVFYNTK